MAVVSRVTTLYVKTVSGQTFGWQASAAVQDTPAGQSVVITVTGINQPGTAEPNSLTMQLRSPDNGNAVIASYALPTAFASYPTTRTFYFTADGTSAAAARAGTLEIYLHAVNTSAPSYNFDSDGSNTAFPLGETAQQIDRGWVRGSTTATVLTSNVAAGGAKPAKYAYPDSLYHRIQFGCQLYGGETWTQRVMNGASVVESFANAAQNVVGGVTVIDHTFGLVRQPTYPASSFAATFDFVAPNCLNLSTGALAVPTTNSFDTATVDPTLTFTRYMQLNSNVWPTNPSTSPNNVAARLISDLGFVAVRVTNSRGEGQNLTGNNTSVGLSYSLVDAGGLVSPIVANGQSTTTQGGEAGWGPLMQWVASLPGGTWNLTATFTDSVAQQGSAVLAYSLLAINPNFKLIVGGGVLTDTPDHFTPGAVLTVGVTLRNRVNSKYAPIDVSPAPTLALLRLYPTAGGGKGQYLASDGVTWTDLVQGGVEHAAYAFALTQSADDPHIWIVQFSAAQTSGWGTIDMFLVGLAYSGGTPYLASGDVAVLGSAHPHGKYVFDALGIFK